MPNSWNCRLLCIALTCLALSACGGGPANDRREAAGGTISPQGGLVSPPADDTSEDIVSWVDGTVVTDWAAEIAKRDHAIEAYLADTDPGRAEKYGFRSGQNP